MNFKKFKENLISNQWASDAEGMQFTQIGKQIILLHKYFNIH